MIFDDIQRDCQPFLGLMRAGASPLFRGATAGGFGFFTGEVHRNRIPKNMPKALHDAADGWFSRTFGVRYRGAGLFCTGDRQQAAVHGAVHMIFPIGGFQFCWSPQVRDLHEWALLDNRLQLPPGDFAEALARLDYREEDLKQGAAAGCEVMVACRRYHAVALDEALANAHLIFATN